LCETLDSHSFDDDLGNILALPSFHICAPPAPQQKRLARARHLDESTLSRRLLLSSTMRGSIDDIVLTAQVARIVEGHRFSAGS
jgi:hypothetical protein